jgi:putative Ca2+/H+ antiporter (TMEM165/GDT1 family)
MNVNLVYVIFAIYGAILLSELVGDRSIFMIGSLTVRFSALSIFCGFAAAFAVKMFVAVLLGRIIAELPQNFVTLTSAITFFITAMIIWFKKEDSESIPNENEARISKGALFTFLAILFSEWGDPGQIMAATLTARYRLPVVVWLAGTLALITKGVLALALGRGLRNRVPMHWLRPVSAIVCLALAVFSVIERR